jgi:membrane protein
MHADTPDSPPSKPGFRRVVISAVVHAQADQIPHLAQAIAFNGFLAIPSALLLAVGVFSATVGTGSMQTLLDHLNSVVPDSVLALVRASMTQLLASDRSDVMIVVGAVFALWSLSGAMQTVMWSLNAAHELTETRGFVRKRIVALLMILVALLAVALVVFMLVLGPTISSWLQDQTGIAAVAWLWDYGRWPLLVLGLLFVFGGVLYLGPDVDVDYRKFHVITPGAVLAVTVWVIASAGLAIYADRFGGYNKVWGSLAAVIVTMTWLWLSSLALLVGAELDAELKRVRGTPEAEPA